jgi:acetyltransferase-like isoleucine patch superfamily enzyme
VRSILLTMHRFIRKRLGLLSGTDLARSLGVRFGKNCKFININKRTFGSEPYLIEMGDHVELTAGVRFLPHDGSVWVFREEEPTIDLMMPIKVGSNVFVGYNAIILPGAEIGDNCIIGAGSVVSGKIPAGTVAAGIPAKVIKTIEEYRQKIDPLLIPTKGMNSKEKKTYLLKHFGIHEENH